MELLATAVSLLVGLIFGFWTLRILYWFLEPMRKRAKRQSEFRKIFGFTPPHLDEFKTRQLLQPLVDQKLMELASSVSATSAEADRIRDRSSIPLEIKDQWIEMAERHYREAESYFWKAHELARVSSFNYQSHWEGYLRLSQATV